MHKVAVIVGSIRRDSINKRLASALETLGAERLTFERLQIEALPLFNQDNEKDPTPEVTRMKEAVKAADAVLFVTPEHNRSIPAALKNAIDWGSRPYGTSCWRGKVGGIIGTSMGSIGTAVAQQHLRTILSGHLKALLGQPESFVVFKEGMIDESGAVADDKTRDFLQRYVNSFADLVDALAKK